MCDAHKALKIYAQTPQGRRMLELPMGDIPSSPPPQEHEFTVGRTLTWLAVGGAVTAAALIAAPHVLPALGIGTTDMAQDAMFTLHNRIAGDGLAGLINKGLEAVPFIGSKLADGGWFNAVASGVVGIGGVLLGRSMHDDKSNKKRYSLGSTIQYAALATSALIALPTVLTAISSGLIYMGMLAGGTNPTPDTVQTISQFIGMVGNTVGTIGNRGGDALMGLSGAAAMTPHFFTCGVSVIPTAVTLGLKRKDAKEQAAETGSHVEKLAQQRSTPPDLAVGLA